MLQITYNTTEEIDKVVLHYLENYNKTCPDAFSKLIIYSTSASDMIRYINDKTLGLRWGEEFTKKLNTAILKTFDNFILDFPKIPKQTDVDKFLAKILDKNEWRLLGTSTFFNMPMTKNHLVLYLNRDESIYSWNADFMIRVQKEDKRVKDFLTKP